MKGTRVFKVLLFINVLCLLWLPNYCDIKENVATSQGLQAHKTLSSDTSRIKNVPSKQKEKPDKVNLGVEIFPEEENIQSNVEFVNNAGEQDAKASEEKVQSPESLQQDTFPEEKQIALDLESSRHIHSNEEITISKRKGTDETSKIQEKSKIHESTVQGSKSSESSIASHSESYATEELPPEKFSETVLPSPSASESVVSASDISKKAHHSVPPTESEKNVFDEHLHHQPPYDGMPSFDEWKKMMLAEQEKGGKKMPSPTPPGKKISSQKRRRNYSSYECGAKIVASNPEAEGASRILNELVDEYMLNPCKAKIWFVIELCETVQASQIELANFELFSSCPKDFVVYSSDNFPTRDWVLLGNFTAAEQRVLQNFELKQEGFGKFVKIELLSHYGGEHYCPLSVVRIFGTSMVDEYEEMETLSNQHDIPDDDLDRLDIPVEDKKSTNIFGSATDAVMSIVKKAAQALGQHQAVDDEQKNDSSAEPQNISEAKVCKLIDSSPEKCEDVNAKAKQGVFSSLSDFSIAPSSVHHSLFRLLHRCDQCVSSHIRYYSSAQPHCRFFQAAFGPVVFQKLCDWFKEHPLIIPHESPDIGKKVPLSDGPFVISPTKSPPPQIMRVYSENDLPLKKIIINDSLPPFTDSNASISIKITNISLDKINKSVSYSEKVKVESSIQPTQVMQKGYSSSYNDSKLSLPLPDESPMPSASVVEDYVTKAVVDVPEKTDISPSKLVAETVTSSTVGSDFTTISDFTASEEEQINEFLTDSNTVSTDDIGLAVTELPSSFKTTEDKLVDGRSEYQGKLEPIAASSGTTAGQKESVFMRMSNRIKALEINMSLSSQYLQELSQRYRRQMEEMQRAFNRTVGTLNDTAKKAAEKDVKQQEILNSLQLQVANLSVTVELLLNERVSVFRQMIETHVCLMIVEAIIMITIMSLCVRRINSTSHRLPLVEQTVVSPPRLSKRRSSADDSSAPIARKVKKRSNSEDNLNAGENVLIVEPLPVLLDPALKAKKRNRKRNRAIQRSNSQPTVQQKCSTSQSTEKHYSHSDGSVHIDIKEKQFHKVSHVCENCNNNSCSAEKITEKEKRLNSSPLQNLTNGSVIGTPNQLKHDSIVKGKEKDKFSFKKFLKFQKRDSI